MASEKHPRSLVGLGLGLSLLACGERRFPMREPVWQDNDRTPVNVKCQTRPTDEDPKHVACSPEPYVSPLAWDAADNSVFRPLAKLFAVDPPGEAPNVNAFDEVPDSAWFQNRIGKQKPPREELLRGACTPEEMLSGENAPPGSWLIDQGKPNGASPGFRIRVGGKRKYMLKTDTPEQPERPTAASAIGAAIYHAVGFNTSCEQIVYFHPSVFTLKPGLIATDNSGIPKAFDQKALDWVFSQAARRGPYLRMQASAWLPGELLGPFRYEGTRSDDPNDTIPHEERRDLRGGRLVAAWLNHFDAREQNTMDSWIASDPKVKDSSPGYIRHYYLDTSDSFGSEWADDGISRRLGKSYLLDFGDIGADLVTFGAVTRTWEEAKRTPGYELFGYYHYRDFDPAGWKNEYPNPAFSRATERDNAWMARILARFERSDIEALVSLGKFSHPEHAEFLTEVLEQRLRKILERYLLRLSPLADLRVEADDRLCAKDLARARGVRPAAAFRYRANYERGDRKLPLAVDVRSNGELCLTLPRTRPPSGIPVRNYTIVNIGNGVSSYQLRAHLYELGDGYRLVGVERDDEAFE
ncbi:MAG TPA: hypothetical protein VGK73_11825 [Polyangiaceae bacterium]